MKLNDRSNEMMYTKKDKLLELPHTGESEKANNTLLSSILILGLMLLRKSRKRDLKKKSCSKYLREQLFFFYFRSSIALAIDSNT